VFDRCSERRRDADWIAARLADPATRIVPVWRMRNLVTSETDPRAVYLSAAALGTIRASSPPIFLGVAGDVVYFAAAIDDADDALASRAWASAVESSTAGTFVELRPIAARLSAFDLAILAHARAMVWWHARHRFCGVCGAPTESREAGHVLACTRAECGAMHHPRTDPAVIVRIMHGDVCLLANQTTWMPEMYSTLAGFVEPGESLEEAVRREVMEEAGVRLTTIRYHSSQPWPYPSSQMIAFVAEAASRELRVDGDELRDARWFARDELKDAVARGEVRLPTAASVARRLVDEWLAG
jgi:NAD+ diphosphatase